MIIRSTTTRVRREVPDQRRNDRVKASLTPPHLKLKYFFVKVL